MALFGLFKGKDDKRDPEPPPPPARAPAPRAPAVPPPAAPDDPAVESDIQRQADDIVSQLAQINSMLGDEETAAPPPPPAAGGPDAAAPAWPVVSGDTLRVDAALVLAQVPPELLSASLDDIVATYGGQGD